MFSLKLPNYLSKLFDTFKERSLSPSESTNQQNMQFENGALKITNNICSLCNVEFENFIDHLVLNNHINQQFLTKEFCSSLGLSSELISSQSLPMSLSSLQTLIFYLKSQKLPLYFKQLYSCHKCLLIFDSIHLLFSHLNKCDFNTHLSKSSSDNNEKLNHPIPVINSHDKCISNVIDNIDETDNNLLEVYNHEDTNHDHDSDIEIVAEIAVQKQPQAQSHDLPYQENVPQRDDVQMVQEEIKELNNPHIKRIEIADNSETLILKSSSFPRPISPSKDFANNHKNGFSPKPTLESRSNKRLLRSLNKKPETKRIEAKRKPKSKEESEDTVIFSSANKKKYNKICGSIFKPLKCKFCNRGNFKHEQNLRVHYQNFHSFFPLQPQSESILSRFTSDEINKYFQFRCLSCLKMFENFTTLSQHRCKYYLKQIHIPKKHSVKSNGKVNMMKPISSSVKPETLPDYESEHEFFKNIGLVRKNISPVKCEHLKQKLQNISNKVIDKTRNNSKSNIVVRVKPTNQCNKNHMNGFAATNTRLSRSIIKVKASLSDDVIISVVPQQPQPTSSKRKHTNFTKP